MVGGGHPNGGRGASKWWEGGIQMVGGAHPNGGRGASKWWEGGIQMVGGGHPNGGRGASKWWEGGIQMVGGGHPNGDMQGRVPIDVTPPSSCTPSSPPHWHPSFQVYTFRLRQAAHQRVLRRPPGGSGRVDVLVHQRTGSNDHPSQLQSIPVSGVQCSHACGTPLLPLPYTSVSLTLKGPQAKEEDGYPEQGGDSP